MASAHTHSCWCWPGFAFPLNSSQTRVVQGDVLCAGRSEFSEISALQGALILLPSRLPTGLLALPLGVLLCRVSPEAAPVLLGLHSVLHAQCARTWLLGACAGVPSWV